MEDEDNEAGSEVSLPSSDISDSNSKKKKPCEICGSDANDKMIVTCLVCRQTREHTYCMKVLLYRVPPMWICEACRSGAPRQVVVRNEEAVHQNVNSDSSNQHSEEVLNPVVEDDSAPVPRDPIPDLNLVPSDSESAN